MGKEKASAALFDQLQAAIEGGEGDDIVGKMKVRKPCDRSRLPLLTAHTAGAPYVGQVLGHLIHIM